MHRQDTYMHLYLSLICSSMQCLTQFTQCEEFSPQYYIRFHCPNLVKGVTCQSILFKRGSISPSSAQSLGNTCGERTRTRTQHYYICTNVLVLRKAKLTFTYLHFYLCHLYAHLSSYDTTCKELSPQYYNRFHDPSSW